MEKKNITSSDCERGEHDGMYNKIMLKVQTRINRELEWWNGCDRVLLPFCLPYLSFLRVSSASLSRRVFVYFIIRVHLQIDINFRLLIDFHFMNRHISEYIHLAQLDFE